MSGTEVASHCAMTIVQFVDVLLDIMYTYDDLVGTASNGQSRDAEFEFN